MLVLWVALSRTADMLYEHSRGDLGVSIAASFASLISIVNRTLGAPLQTGYTVCTVVQPAWSTFIQANVLRWTNLNTDTTPVAGLINQEIPVLYLGFFREGPVVGLNEGGGL